MLNKKKQGSEYRLEYATICVRVGNKCVCVCVCVCALACLHIKYGRIPRALITVIVFQEGNYVAGEQDDREIFHCLHFCVL